MNLNFTSISAIVTFILNQLYKYVLIVNVTLMIEKKPIKRV